MISNRIKEGEEQCERLEVEGFLVRNELDKKRKQYKNIGEEYLSG